MKIELNLSDIKDEDFGYECSFKDLIKEEITKALVIEIRQQMNEELKKKRQILQALIRDACDKIQYPNPQDIIDQFMQKDINQR